jgi:hypothetical protein
MIYSREAQILATMRSWHRIWILLLVQYYID